MEKKGGVFRVKSRNRVFDETRFRGKKKRFLTGKQGKWHEEEHIVVTPDKNEVGKRVRETIQSRTVLGKPKFRQKDLKRDIVIDSIKEAQLDDKKDYIPLPPIALRDYYGKYLSSDLQEVIQIRKKRAGEFDRNNLGPNDIVEYVSSVKEEIIRWKRINSRSVFELGYLFADMKKLLPHREFQSWVEENTPYKIRSAQNMMKVYECCFNVPEIVQYFKPSVLYIICRSTFPEKLRQEFLQNDRGVYDISVKEIKVIADKYLKGEITTDSDEVQKFFRKQNTQEVKRRYVDALKGFKKDATSCLNSLAGLNKSHTYNPLESETDQALPKEYTDLESFFEDIISGIEGKVLFLEAIA